MELLLGIQVDNKRCQIVFRQSNGFYTEAEISIDEESYPNFCKRVSRRILRLLSTPDGIRPVTAVGVVVDGIVHDNTVLTSSALPFLVGESLANDFGRELGLSDVPIGVIGNVTAALLGSRSDFQNHIRGVELAGALEFASSLAPTK